MKRYSPNAKGMSGTVDMFEFDQGEWVKYTDHKAVKDAADLNSRTLKIIYKSIIAKDYIAAIELLSEVIDPGMGNESTGVSGGA